MTNRDVPLQPPVYIRGLVRLPSGAGDHNMSGEPIISRVAKTVKKLGTEPPPPVSWGAAYPPPGFFLNRFFLPLGQEERRVGKLTTKKNNRNFLTRHI